MLIGGLQKLSLIDYPDQVATIVFTQGCNFRCHFCYNPQLVVPAPSQHTGAGPQKDYSLMSEDSLFGFLEKRKGKLDAVVVTGGEPTMHQDLPEFLQKIKDLGYLVKLDTNGTNPEIIQNLIKQKLVDYIAMDIKGSLDKYEKITGVKVSLENIKKSIIMIKTSGLPYEFRSTIMPEFHTQADIKKMGELIKNADKWFLQKFKSNIDLIDGEFKNKKSYTDVEMKELCEIGKQYVKFCDIR